MPAAPAQLAQAPSLDRWLALPSQIEPSLSTHIHQLSTKPSQIIKQTAKINIIWADDISVKQRNTML
jgi:hypothetical protein